MPQENGMGDARRNGTTPGLNQVKDLKKLCHGFVVDGGIAPMHPVDLYGTHAPKAKQEENGNAMEDHLRYVGQNRLAEGRGRRSPGFRVINPTGLWRGIGRGGGRTVGLGPIA